MPELSTEMWLAAGIVAILLVLTLLVFGLSWRRRRIERFRRWDQLDSVHNSRERRLRGD
jgi:DMSO/TMAO reductase YedYZ heme-binding membrane subunit